MTTQIKDVMSTNFKYITPETTNQEAAEIMKTMDVGFLPVGENDRLVGMITDRDIVTRTLATGKDPKTTTARDTMTPKTYYCFEDQTVGEICTNMAEIKVRRLPVMNRDKRMVGIVSMGDVAQQATRAETGNALQEITIECANTETQQAA